MKKFALAFLFVFFYMQMFAQAPEAINYQAIVRGDGNNPLVSQNVSFRMSILGGSISGPEVYVETHSATTNQFGLVNLAIGNGTVESGDFSRIDWNINTFFLKVEIDPDGGTDYDEMGTTQMLSVPYALYAKSAETATFTLVETDPVFLTSPANGITAADITHLADLSGVNTGDQDLSSLATKTELTDGLDLKVDKVTGKGLSTEDYTTAEKTKLAGIEENANNYIHPDNHPASIITQDENNRFVTDAEKAEWNSKQAELTAGNGINISSNVVSLSPGTSVGEMYYWDGSEWISVEPGETGQVLTYNAGVPTWAWTSGSANGAIMNSVTGKTWQDRNLGATRVALSYNDAQAYGDLYQWGRCADGHQLRTSTTTSTLSGSDIPGNSFFIKAPDSPYDWRSPQNNNLWQGVIGINNPCPYGFRIPTEAELETERQSWISNDRAGAFASPLKLPSGGYRSFSDGSLISVGSGGCYWSSTLYIVYSKKLDFSSSSASIGSAGHAYGYSVRCIYGGNYEVLNPATGKFWMDRNLGASQVATSSTDEAAYGDLYQWGRGSDGHQLRTSETTTTLSTGDLPGHDDFILAASYPYDWRDPQNDNLWEGADGINHPCPDGFRIPTSAELDNELLSWTSNDAAGAFASPLRLTVAGYRIYYNGEIVSVGSGGEYWTSTVGGLYTYRLDFSSSDASIGYDNIYRSYGFSVRCIKD